MARLTLDVGSKFDNLLTDLARGNETTKAEVIRRSVALYAFLKAETKDEKKVAITTAGGQVLKEIVLP
jgi:hypothetical protein